MSTDGELTPEQLEAQQLRELLASPGWLLFQQHVEQQWGAEAQLKMLDQAYGELKPGDTRGEKMTALQVRAAAKAVRLVMAYPSERIGMQAAKQPAPRAFGNWRRT